MFIIIIRVFVALLALIEPPFVVIVLVGGGKMTYRIV